jgi:hypothetical protein
MSTPSEDRRDRHGMSVRATADALAEAMIARNHAGLMAHYAEDVTFHSPVTPRPFEGRHQVGEILRAVIEGFEHWERTFVLTNGNTCVFGVRARIGGRDVEFAELIRVDERGRVIEMRVNARPLAGVAAIAAVAAPALLGRRNPVRGRIAGALMGPLPAVLAAADRGLMHLVHKELGTPPM